MINKMRLFTWNRAARVASFIINQQFYRKPNSVSIKKKHSHNISLQWQLEHMQMWATLFILSHVRFVGLKLSSGQLKTGKRGETVSKRDTLND